MSVEQHDFHEVAHAVAHNAFDKRPRADMQFDADFALEQCILPERAFLLHFIHRKTPAGYMVYSSRRFTSF
ncbi:hypothetical protein [Paraburkholderia rhizosphaerae]|uniref:hypothetical protein n=1 Tax=Paraburkholderia rhizosphaerae TaxID=480658 RepID=UPI0010654DC9|nr:hypothetical protein [Paraburkholderia rhizosphaerae]